MRNFQVPYDQKIEDKVVNGVLTMKQFLILLSNFAILYSMFFVSDSHFQEIEGKSSIITWVLLAKLLIAII